jgi:hypothetical protein
MSVSGCADMFSLGQGSFDQCKEVLDECKEVLSLIFLVCFKNFSAFARIFLAFLFAS